MVFRYRTFATRDEKSLYRNERDGPSSRKYLIYFTINDQVKLKYI